MQNDYILSLNPEMFKETVPVYYGSDGNYYVVSTVPMLNGIESADYQPATNFYNDSVVAEAFTDIQYLGSNGADVSTQTVIEVLNTLCWQMQMKDFRSTDQMLHPVVEEAQKTVKERIANYKQKKDFKQT